MSRKKKTDEVVMVDPPVLAEVDQAKADEVASRWANTTYDDEKMLEEISTLNSPTQAATRKARSVLMAQKNYDPRFLMGHLLTKFKEHQGANYGEYDEGPTNWPVEQFVEFCNKWLADHPPVTVDFLSKGLGFQMATGQRIGLCPGATKYNDNIHDPEVPVTSVNRKEYQMPNTPFFKVF